MARLAQPTLMHWAVRCSGLENVSKRLLELGWSPTEIRRMHRTPPGGARLDWELFGVQKHPLWRAGTVFYRLVELPEASDDLATRRRHRVGALGIP